MTPDGQGVAAGTQTAVRRELWVHHIPDTVRLRETLQGPESENGSSHSDIDVSGTFSLQHPQSHGPARPGKGRWRRRRQR